MNKRETLLKQDSTANHHADLGNDVTLAEIQELHFQNFSIPYGNISQRTLQRVAQQAFSLDYDIELLKVSAEARLMVKAQLEQQLQSGRAINRFIGRDVS